MTLRACDRGTKHSVMPTIIVDGFVVIARKTRVAAGMAVTCRFVEHNRFDGKRVVLLNTSNSELSEEQTNPFRVKIMVRAASSFEHHYVRRGRMTRQIPPDELLHVIDRDWALQDSGPCT